MQFKKNAKKNNRDNLLVCIKQHHWLKTTLYNIISITLQKKLKGWEWKQQKLKLSSKPRHAVNTWIFSQQVRNKPTTLSFRKIIILLPQITNHASLRKIKTFSSRNLRVQHLKRSFNDVLASLWFCKCDGHNRSKITLPTCHSAVDDDPKCHSGKFSNC
jgi:hypothetical protein